MSLQYRLFWTWDHSTNWCHNIPGNQTVGASNEYAKAPETFLEDYRRVIDWGALHKIDAIGIAGLLRDRHGGIEYARKLCSYAREKNVRIYAVAGLLAYGGIFYEGNSEFSLENFLEKNPECMARNMDGTPLIFNFPSTSGTKKVRHACPSNPKLESFVYKSLEWLFATIPELGGIQFETGDTGICFCEKCKKRREHPISNTMVSFEDMIMYYPKAVETVLSASPDAWAICETYHHFNLIDGDGKPDAATCSPAFGSGIPEWVIEGFRKVPREAFFQWVCDAWLENDSWKTTDKMPLDGYRHVMRAHPGTYWLGYRHKLSIEKIRKQCNLSESSHLQGVSLFGEGSPFHANVEFNYLAMEYFADNPFATVDAFTSGVMAEMLGGYELAKNYIEYESLTNTPEKIGLAIAEIVKFIPQLDKESARRWIWLSSYLGTFEWEMRLKSIQKSI